MTEHDQSPGRAMWVAIPPRFALPLWLGACGIAAAVVGLPVLLASFAFAAGPTYASGRRERGFSLAFDVAVVGACVGALVFSHQGIVAAGVGAVVTGAIVGVGMSSWAMWFALKRRMG